MLSSCIVFSCTAMERDQQTSMQSRSVTFSDASSQTSHGGTSCNELAQRVAQLSVMSSSLAHCPQKTTFSVAQEHIKALRRSLVPHENNCVVNGSSPRVITAVDCVLGQAFTKLVDGQTQFNALSQSTSLSPADKKTVYAAQIISFKQIMNALFASIDRESVYYGDEPRITTNHVVTCDADGAMLASIEAVECFSKATDDNTDLCVACKNCPPELWCSDCQDADRGHSRITPFVHNVTRETEQRVGVNDALWYLESRVGPTSKEIDAYAGDEKVSVWAGVDRVGTYADARKILLNTAAAHKEIIESIAKMSDEQLRVETVLPLLENAPGSIGLAESAVKNTHSRNPLRFLPAQLFCKAALGSATQELDDATKDLPAGMTLADIARLVREGTKISLGITEKELPLLCQLTHILSQPLNLLIKEGVVCLRESAVDVERFAVLYKKPLREQLLSPECSKQFELLAHAWKTGSIVAPHVLLRAPVPGQDALQHNVLVVRGVKPREKQKQSDEESVGKNIKN